MSIKPLFLTSLICLSLSACHLKSHTPEQEAQWAEKSMLKMLTSTDVKTNPTHYFSFPFWKDEGWIRTPQEFYKSLKHRPIPKSFKLTLKTTLSPIQTLKEIKPDLWKKMKSTAQADDFKNVFLAKTDYFKDGKLIDKEWVILRKDGTHFKVAGTVRIRR